MTIVDLSARISLVDDVVSTEFDGERVIMSVEQGKYTELNQVGSRIWATLEQGPVTAEIICDELCRRYDVARAECEREVTAFIGQLMERGLVVKA